MTPEHWSWSKLFKGFFDGKNYAKSLVFGVCLTIMIVIGYSTFTVIKSHFTKPIQTVGTNSGTITNTDKQGNTWSLLNLFNWR